MRMSHRLFPIQGRFASLRVVACKEHSRRSATPVRRTIFSSAWCSGKAKDWNKHEEFFGFTRGRFVCDESEQMAQRYLTFNVNALCKIAADAVGKTCVHVEKLPDGMYNKALLLSMDDQTQVVAKLPNPNAGQPHFTTASEVATMDFMRNVLKLPAPQVLSSSSRDDNAVGAEYIIMEKAKGVQLQTVWADLTFGQRIDIIRSVGRLQRAWAKASFNRIGNLYYKNDIKHQQEASASYVDRDSTDTIELPQFVMGPILGREWVDLGRATLACDRGPWSSTLAYRQAMIEKEMQAVRELERLPRPLAMLCGPGLYQQSREKKLRAGELALQTLPHWLPNDEWASTFHFWHNDLHAENIFVDSYEPSTILSVIDWQSAHVAPLFDQSIFPGYLSYDGPTVEGMEEPAEPDLPKNASTEEKAEAERLHEARLLAFGFKRLLRKHVAPAFQALMYSESEDSNVLTTSRRILEFGEAHCVASIGRLPGSPVILSGSEIAQAEADVHKVAASMHAMNVIAKALGPLFPENGVVRPDEYEDAKAALRWAKPQVIEDFSKSAEDRVLWEEAWPFDD